MPAPSVASLRDGRVPGDRAYALVQEALRTPVAPARPGMRKADEALLASVSTWAEAAFEHRFGAAGRQAFEEFASRLAADPALADAVASGRHDALKNTPADPASRSPANAEASRFLRAGEAYMNRAERLEARSAAVIFEAADSGRPVAPASWSRALGTLDRLSGEVFLRSGLRLGKHARAKLDDPNATWMPERFLDEPHPARSSMSVPERTQGVLGPDLSRTPARAKQTAGNSGAGNSGDQR